MQTPIFLGLQAKVSPGVFLKFKSISFFFLTGLLISAPVFGQNDSLTTASHDTLEVDNDFLDAPLHFTCTDSVTFNVDENNACLYGSAVVEYTDKKLEADRLCIDTENQTILSTGGTDSLGKITKVKFHDAGEIMESEKMLYNLKTKKGKIYGAFTKQTDLLVYGKEIKVTQNDIVYLNDMKCIPCNDPNSKTIFRAKKAKVIPDDKIVTGPIYLEIAGIPTPLVLPFGYFPNTRKQKSGILLPFVGNSPGLGLNLRDGGFYWAISDKTDLTFRTDIYTNGSFGVRILNNYNVRYKMAGMLEGGYSRFLSGDRDIPGNFQIQQSYSFRWVHRTDNRSNPTMNFQSQVNYMSNKYNRFNALNTGQFLTNAVNSNISFSKNFHGSQLLISALHSQNMQSHDVTLTLPQITWNVNRFFPFKKKTSVRENVLTRLGISYSFEAKNDLAGKDTTLFKQDLTKTMRYGARHLIPLSTNFFVFKYITITPALNLSAVMYDKTIRKRYENNALKTDTIKEFSWAPEANASMNASTRIYFDYIFRKGKVKQIRHLLIPTLSYIYRPDFGKEEWGWWRKIEIPNSSLIQYYSIHEIGIYGGTSRGKQNALSLNLNNNIEAKTKSKNDTAQRYTKKVWLQNLSISGSYNFAADSFHMSLISVSARNVFFKFFDWVGNATFDPYTTDKITNRRLNEFEWNKNGRPARFINASSAVNISINPEILKNKNFKREAPNLTNAAERYADENFQSWNAGLFYTMSYSSIGNKGQWDHVLNGRLDLKPGKFWQFGITSGWDFKARQFSYTSVDVYRELRCWEFRIQWIPFGFRKGYNFSMNLRNPMMSDFKIPRVRNWYDNL
ncbi:MAG: putative LPS assembly protein LptD [Bacteroidia bacterium]|nr:putative LPS assembly protein LptD [Bacteroidia bacterium]